MNSSRIFERGSRASESNPGTFLLPSSVTSVSPPLDFRELFIRHYRHIKGWYERLSEPGLAVVALSPGQVEAKQWLATHKDDINTAIIGRHRRCDLCLSADSFVSLRHLVVIVYPGNEGKTARFRLLDLRTSLGFAIEDGRRLETLEAQGPVLVRCGIYAVLLFPTQDGGPGWPEDPQAGWEMIPERVYSHERPAEDRGSQGRWRGRGVANRQGGWDGGGSSTLVCLMPGLGPARRNLLAAGEEALGDLIVRSSEGEMTVVVGGRAVRQGVVLGRYDRCDNEGLPVLSDPGISRVHLLVVEIAGELYAIDTASTNGLMAGSGTGSRVCLSRSRALQLSRGLATLEWQPRERTVGDVRGRVSRSLSLVGPCPPRIERPVGRWSPPSTDQRRILDLYEAGLYLRAYRLAQQYGPLHTWQGTPARILAGLLAMNLGGRRLGYALHLRAARADPRSPAARYYAARALLDRQGAAVAWARMRAGGEMEDAPVEVRADWLSLQATVAGRFRDFEAAEALLRHAEGLAPGRASTWIERAKLLEEQDHHAEALDAAREALRLRPGYHPGLEVVARLLLILGRGDEARELLSQAAAVIESGHVAGQLAAILAEQRRFLESLEWLQRFEGLSPLLDRQGRMWLAARRSDALYELGEIGRARWQAALAGNPFHAAVAERLGRGGHDTRRVLLPVPFVQQHHKTCVPATLVSLAAFWGRPLDQSAVAEAVCYDGTPVHRARAWAEQGGWAVREFRLTWASACALLDRGVPFALTTASALAGHEQAVVGYDARRGTLDVRDPSQPFLREFLAEPFFEAQGWSGPRAAVFLPREEKERLADVVLPDAEAYDTLYAIEVALQAHRRGTAEQIQRRMATAAPDHPLTLWAALLLAADASDPARQLQCIEALLKRFPDTPSLLFWKLSLLQSFAPPAEYARVLAETCERHRGDVALLSRLAHQLSLEPREHPAARRILRTLLRAGHWPTQALNLFSLANIFEAQGRRDEAMELSRFAACLEDRNEGFVMPYFAAARSRGKTDEALAFLRRRFEELGRRSGRPGRTLFWALRELGRKTEAFDALERALAVRPADGELMLFAGEAHARCGRLGRADELLSAAHGCTGRATWLRAAAEIASRRGAHAVALRSWREVLVAEPSSLDAHRAVARLLAATEGNAAAVAHLKSACERFPHHQSLRRLSAEWESSIRAQRGPGMPRLNLLQPGLKLQRPQGFNRNELHALVQRALPIMALLIFSLSRSCS